MLFEQHHQPLLPPAAFFRRVVQFALLSFLLVAVSLGLGMLGYHTLEGLSWSDSYLNAAMILSGMGPVSPLQTEAGKLFAATYALYTGLVFLSAAGLLVLPLLHRLIHYIHLRRPGALE